MMIANREQAENPERMTPIKMQGEKERKRSATDATKSLEFDLSFIDMRTEGCPPRRAFVKATAERRTR